MAIAPIVAALLFCLIGAAVAQVTLSATPGSIIGSAPIAVSWSGVQGFKYEFILTLDKNLYHTYLIRDDTREVLLEKHRYVLLTLHSSQLDVVSAYLMNDNGAIKILLTNTSCVAFCA